MASLITWNPFRDLKRVNWNFDQLFREFMEPSEISEEAYCESPRVESFRHNGSYVVRVDLPGVNPKDVRLTVDQGLLTVEGERKREKDVEESTWYRDELCYGAFRRSLDIPDGVKADQIKARYRDGVLEITAPLEEHYLPKKIEVEVQKS